MLGRRGRFFDSTSTGHLQPGISNDTGFADASAHHIGGTICFENLDCPAGGGDLMGDKRAFALLDVGYMDNPKIMDVFDASSDAFCMHLASILYCAQHLTDGEVSSKTIQRKVGGTSADTQLLIDAGLWHGQGHGCSDCPSVTGRDKVYVHDYLQHNRRSATVKGKSIQAAKAAHARWSDADRIAISNAEDTNPHSDQQCETDESAHAEQDDPLLRKKERKKEVKDLSSEQDEFDRWYATYPRKEAKANARRAFTKARKSAEMDTLMAGVERYVDSVKGKERQFIALPATWLNAGRWEDEYAPSRQQQVPSLYAHFNQ